MATSARTTLEMSGAGLGGARPMKLQGNEDWKMVFGRFVFSSSYTTGGESLTPEDVGLNEINLLLPTIALSSGGGAAIKTTSLGAVYDYTNEMMVAVGGSAGGATLGRIAGGSEIDQHSDLSGFTVRFVAFGT